MKLNEISYPDGRPVDGYGPGFFRIGGQVYQGPVTVLLDSVQSWAGYDDPAPFTAMGGQIDVLFVGTGADMCPIPSGFRKAVEDAGIGVEIMNSPTACRTYNVLLSEGRRIGLALIPV